MAIKGCSRKMVVINGTGGSIFETAYFIVKTEAAEISRGDMMREANRIVAEHCFSSSRRPRRSRAATFAAGVVAGAVLVGLCWLVAALI